MNVSFTIVKYQYNVLGITNLLVDKAMELYQPKCLSESFSMLTKTVRIMFVCK